MTKSNVRWTEICIGNPNTNEEIKILSEGLLSMTKIRNTINAVSEE